MSPADRQPEQFQSRQPSDTARRVTFVCWTIALAAAASPLWVSSALPMVDAPQHLYLISVLHRLSDPTTVFPQVFEARPGFTPYLGYYYLVSLLNWLLPLELANRLFLSAIVVGLPLSLAFFLRSLNRNTWPALLAIPFSYGDSFAWGFVNYLAAVPVALVCAAFFVRSLTAQNRAANAVALAVSLLAVLTFHIQLFLWLAIVLPLLLLTTVPREGYRAVKSRVAALLGVAPAVVLSLVWAVGRFTSPPEIGLDEPWKASGPLLSAANLRFKDFATNKAELYSSLANMLRSQADERAVQVSLAIAVIALLASLVWRAKPQEPWFERARLPLALGVTLALFFLLPYDIRGLVYGMNTRYASLCAALAVCLPSRPFRHQQLFTTLAAAVSISFAWPMISAFRDFDREHAVIDRLSKSIPSKSKIMAINFNLQTRTFRHALFLHAAAELAMSSGGMCHFTFASTPHSPLRYKGIVPPTFPSEWNPGQFQWKGQGDFYDVFLVRGVTPSQLPELQQAPVEVLAEDSGWYLLKHRRQ
jgi:hypothetical protein